MSNGILNRTAFSFCFVKSFLCREATQEISQPRSGWYRSNTVTRPEATMENSSNFRSRRRQSAQTSALKGRQMIAPGKSAQRTQPGVNSKKHPSLSGFAGRAQRVSPDRRTSADWLICSPQFLFELLTDHEPWARRRLTCCRHPAGRLFIPTGSWKEDFRTPA